jgi:hypothetical protein
LPQVISAGFRRDWVNGQARFFGDGLKQPKGMFVLLRSERFFGDNQPRTQAFREEASLGVLSRSAASPSLCRRAALISSTRSRAN